MRHIQKTEHKQLGIKHSYFDEGSRVEAAVAKTGRDYLPESFDLRMVKFPVWRTNQKSKWNSPSGFDLYSGHPSSHVGYEHPG
jgi:hypothetical protein